MATARAFVRVGHTQTHELASNVIFMAPCAWVGEFPAHYYIKCISMKFLYFMTLFFFECAFQWLCVRARDPFFKWTSLARAIAAWWLLALAEWGKRILSLSWWIALRDDGLDKYFICLLKIFSAPCPCWRAPQINSDAKSNLHEIWIKMGKC
jgi:hypothetical protein